MQVAAAAAVAFLGVVTPSVADAADDDAKRYDVNITRQPLDAALRKLARQTGLQVGRFSDVRDSGPMVGPLFGKYSVDQALNSLLKSSGLTFQPLNERAFIVLASPQGSRQTDDASCLDSCDPSTRHCSNKQSGDDMENQIRCTTMSYLVVGVIGAGMMSANSASYAQSAAGAPDSGEAVGLEEIIVTAQRREENLQRTPISITAISAHTIESLSAQSLQDITRLAPNATVDGGGGVGGSRLYIRGIGQQQLGVFSDPGSTLYVDGVYRPRMVASAVNLADAERIEVLRGPQGTLFGKNAVGGAVSIITRAPRDEFGGNFTSEFGSRDRRRFGAAVNLPIAQERVALQLAGESNTQNGYMRNLQTGARMNDTDYRVGRGNLLWKLTDDLSLMWRADYAKQDQTAPAQKIIAGMPPLSNYISSNQYATQGIAPSYNQAKDSGTSLTLDWANVGVGSFRSITAYRDFSTENANDADGTPVPMFTVPSAVRNHFWTEELQYNATQFDDRLKWTTGLFFMNEFSYGEENARIDLRPIALIQQDTYGRQNTKSYAVFGQATYSITDKLDATVGLRYSRDEKDIHFVAYDLTSGSTFIDQHRSNTWSAWTPKFALQYEPTESLMFYGTTSRGYKAGGYNRTPTTAAEFRSFNPEYLWNYEAGVKSEWLERRVRANLAIYRMEYTDIQIVFTDAGALNYVDNAGDARIDGVEAELSFLPIPQLLLNASFGLNDFKYTRIAPGADDITYDSTVSESPKTTAAIGAQYTFAFNHGAALVLRSDYAWKSKTYFDAVNDESVAQAAYGLWSARATYTSRDGRWEVFGYGKNLADEYFHVNGEDQGFFVIIEPGASRELGVGVKLRFGG